jgi:hypothetical protein
LEGSPNAAGAQGRLPVFRILVLVIRFIKCQRLQWLAIVVYTVAESTLFL